MRIRYLNPISNSLPRQEVTTYRFNNIFRVIQLLQMIVISPFHHRTIDLRCPLHSQLIFLVRQTNILADRTRTLPAPEVITDLIFFGLLVGTWSTITTVAAEPVDPFRVLVGHASGKEGVA